jgi:ferritin
MHAMKLFDFVTERGGRVVLDAIDKPKTEWDSALAVFEETFAHEQKVTALIAKLVDLAKQESDHATDNFLQWFVAEQVEEEASADKVRQSLKMIGEAGSGLYMLDREMAQRVFTPPASAEE